MRRRYWIPMLALAAAACGDRTPAPPPSPEPAAEAPAENDAVMRGRTSLYLYDAADAGGSTGKPRFEVKDVLVELDAEGAWSFQDAQAVIYGRDGSEAHLKAGSGSLQEAGADASGEQTLERAHLTGGVTMEAGGKTIELEDIEWLNAEGVARSAKPVVLRDANSEVAASSLEYYPDTNVLLLTDARGTVYPAPAAEAPAPDGEPAAPESGGEAGPSQERSSQ